MIKEISKTVVEKVRVCDIDTCQYTAEFTCIVCNKDICGVHLYCTAVDGVLKYLCTSCANRPFSEIYFQIKNHTYVVYTSVIYPNNCTDNITYPPYRIFPAGTGDHSYRWLITIVCSSSSSSPLSYGVL